MPVKNPYSVSYDDLIESTQQRLKWMEDNYPRMKMEGRIKDWVATHNIEIEKVKLKLFRKFKKEPQADLFNEFKKMQA